MSLYKPGPANEAIIGRPVWPRFTPPPPREAYPPAHDEPTAAAAMPAAKVEVAAPPVSAVHEDILRQAKLEAAQILQEAAVEAEAAVEGARKEGHEAGYREGLAQGASEVELMRQQAQGELEKARMQAEAVRQQAEVAAQALRNEAEAKAQALLLEARQQADQIAEEGRVEQHRRIDAAGGALVELAVAAAQRLVQGHLGLHPEAVGAMMAAGLRRLKDTNCTVRVSPQDLPLLEAQRSALERELATGFLQLQPDPGLSPGNYIINSPQGQIDGRLETQAQVMRSALKNALGGTSS